MEATSLACPIKSKSICCHGAQAPNVARCVFGMQWLMRAMSSDDGLVNLAPVARVEDRLVLGETRSSCVVDPCKIGQASVARQG